MAKSQSLPECIWSEIFRKKINFTKDSNQQKGHPVFVSADEEVWINIGHKRNCSPKHAGSFRDYKIPLQELFVKKWKSGQSSLRDAL
jgi:hypothetical protein